MNRPNNKLLQEIYNLTIQNLEREKQTSRMNINANLEIANQNNHNHLQPINKDRIKIKTIN